MENNALLYFFSTLAQSLAALAALPAIFVHFKTTALLRLMVGLGQSMLDRWSVDDAYRTVFVPALGDARMQQRQFARLRGAVDRHDIAKIEEVMRHFVEIEQSRESSPPSNGFGGMHQHFQELDHNRKVLGRMTALCVILALAGIVSAMLGIGAIHGNWRCVLSLCTVVSVILGSATLLAVGNTVMKGIQDPREWELHRSRVS